MNTDSIFYHFKPLYPVISVFSNDSCSIKNLIVNLLSEGQFAFLRFFERNFNNSPFGIVTNKA